MSGDIALQITKMLKNDVLVVEAVGMKGKDQGDSIFVPSGERGSKSRTVGRRKTRIKGPSTTAGR